MPGGRRVRVLMSADAVGGVWTYALELAAAMEPMGVEFVLAVMGGGPSADQRDAAERLGNVRLEVAGFKLEWMPQPWAEVDAAGEWLLGLARRHRADLVHLNSMSHGALEFRVPKVVVGHSCVCSWWRAVKGTEAPREWDQYRARVGAGLRGADAVVAPTAAMLGELRRWYGLGKGDGAALGPRVIWNGRDPVLGVSLTGKDPLVLAAGRVWDEAKNVGLLARVAGEVGWPCVAAGERGLPGCTEVSEADGSVARPPVARSAAARPLVMLGRVPPGDMARLVQRAAVFVHPARYEPFGLAALEAGLAGCALVLGDIPSLREVWGEAAVYVDPEDAAGLRAAIARLIEDDASRLRAGNAARERGGRYSRARMGRGYAALYGELLGIDLGGGRTAADERVWRPAAAGAGWGGGAGGAR